MKRRALGLTIWSGIVALLTVPRITTSDGLERWRELDQLLRHGTLSTQHFSLIGPLFAAPLAALDLWLGQEKVLTQFYNLTLFFIVLAAAWIWLEPYLGRLPTMRFVALLVFGSLFPSHTINFYGETFTAVCLGLGSAALCLDYWGAGAGLLVIGAANSPAALVPVGLMILYHARQKRDWRWLALPVVPLMLILLENRVRRGDFFNTGYEGNGAGQVSILPFSGRPGFSYPFILGAFSILFSFGKGLLFYTPGLFVPFVRPDLLTAPKPPIRKILNIWLVGAVGFVLVYSKWWGWHGDEFWGPRFFLFCSLPASLALALALGDLRSKRGLVAGALVVLLVFWVGYDGLVFGEHQMDLCYRDGGAWGLLCWYVPEFSALARPFVSPRALGSKDTLFAVIWLAGFAALLGNSLRLRLKRAR